MARTKASVGSKISSGKSNKSRCGAPPPNRSYVASSGSGERSSRGHTGGGGGSGGGGNSVCPRDTPKWQLPITNFFCNKDTSGCSDDEAVNGAAASTSKPKPKHNVIQSDDEEDDTSKEERPKNKVLDETIELEPLTGEDSHKIEEYYKKNDNGEENEIIGEKNEINGDENKVNGELNEINGKESGIIGKMDKGKGKGKKTNKENVNSNIEGRKSVKRDLEEVVFGEESEHVKKKRKIISD